MGRTLEPYLARINRIMGIEPGDGLHDAYTTLVRLHRRRGIASIHALLQYIVSAHLYVKGYDVQVEKELDGGLRADIYGEAPWGDIVVEVETGYIPYNLLLHGDAYLRGRITYKLLSYSGMADEFTIALPGSIDPASIIPRWAVKPPEERSEGDFHEALRLLKTYFPHRARLVDRLDEAILSKIYLVKTSEVSIEVIEVDVESIEYPRVNTSLLYIL